MNAQYQILQELTEKKPAREILELILQNRQIKDREEFLVPKKVQDITFASLFEDEKAYKHSLRVVLQKLQEAKEMGEKIIIWGDYDADGITGTAIMWLTLQALGFDAHPFIPERKAGYGFNSEDLQQIIDDKLPAVMITVDHGIRGHEGIDMCGSLGITSIITDHHSKSDTQPAADAIFHTTLVSGSSVAYFLGREIAQHFDKEQKTKALFEADFLSLAAIGLIADMVPLLGEARSIAYYGLKSFNIVQNLAILELMRELEIPKDNVSTYHVGFLLAPRLNAFGRVESAMNGLRMLCSKKTEYVAKMVANANEINQKRQKIVQDEMKLALENVDSKEKILLYTTSSPMEGVVGLIASKLLQTYYRPAIVFSCHEGICRASGRGVEGLDLTAFVGIQSHLLLGYGGHKGAMGLSLEEKNLQAFQKAILTQAETDISSAMLEKRIEVDLLLPLECVDLELLQELKKLEPMGMGNREVLLASQVTLESKRSTKNPKVTQFVFTSASGAKIEGVEFDAVINDQEIGREIALVYKPQLDSYGGKAKAKVIVKGKIE